MSQKERKQKRIKQIVDDAAKALEAEGVKYFIGALDHEGDKAYERADLKGEDFYYILKLALPTKEDAQNLGIWAMQLIQSFKP